MSKHTSSLCHGLTIVSGIFLLMYSSVENVTASLSEIVSSRSLIPATEEILHSSSYIPASAEGIGLEIVVGALLVVLGLLFHAFFMLRKESAYLSSLDTNKPRKIQIMWMEIWRR